VARGRQAGRIERKAVIGRPQTAASSAHGAKAWTCHSSTMLAVRHYQASPPLQHLQASKMSFDKSTPLNK
jgi:hypothetical protein